MKLEKGDLIFEKGTGPINWLIRLRTWSKYSHVAMYIGNGEIIESHWFGGVQVRNLNEAITYDYDVYEFDGVTESQRKQIVKNTLEWEGHKYDKWQIIGFGFKGWLLGRNKLNSPKLIICSELIMKGVKGVLNILKDKYIGDITPADLTRDPLVKPKIA